jgi:hypothetical protein
MAADSTKWLPFLDAGLGRLAALEQGVPAERGDDPHSGSPAVATMIGLTRLRLRPAG